MARTRKVGMTMMLNQNRKEERAMRKGYQAPLARPAGMCCSASGDAADEPQARRAARRGLSSAGGDAARRSRRGAAPRRREPRAEWIRGEGRRLADASRELSGSEARGGASPMRAEGGLS